MKCNERHAAGVTSLSRWAAAWGDVRLLDGVRIEFSDRLRAKAGRAFPLRRLVRIAGWLRGHDALLDEVICHELAHIVAFAVHGHAIRPHGPEWKELMRRAGYEPRVLLRLPAGIGPPPPPRRAGPRVAYLHRCPVCQAARLASRRMTRWRCADCYGAGLTGELEIVRHVGMR